MKKVSALFTVRNSVGQYMGTYYAFTAEAAISRFNWDNAQYSSTFKKSGTRITGIFTATVEETTNDLGLGTITASSNVSISLDDYRLFRILADGIGCEWFPKVG